MTRDPSKSRRLFVKLPAAILAAVLVAALLATFFFGRTSPPVLPNPNGYDDLLKAAGQLTGKVSEFSELDQDGLRDLLSANAEALRGLRVGLKRSCQVPTETVIAGFSTVMTDLINLKHLATLCLAEGRLAEMEHRSADAARSYIDAVHLGIAMSRGGFLINRLVGIACEGMGCQRLVKLVPDLTCEQARPLISELEQIETDTVPWGDVIKCENRFERAQLGKYPNPIRLISELWQARGVRKQARMKHDLAAAHLRLIITELALRCYRSEKNLAPVSLSELVPSHLKRVPMDPFGNSWLIYRAQGTNWSLYSVGPDRIDDGGRGMNRSSFNTLDGFGIPGKIASGDLLHDSPW